MSQRSWLVPVKACAGLCRTPDVHILAGHKVRGGDLRAHRQHRVRRHPELVQAPLDGHAGRRKVPPQPGPGQALLDFVVFDFGSPPTPCSPLQVLHRITQSAVSAAPARSQPEPSQQCPGGLNAALASPSPALFGTGGSGRALLVDLLVALGPAAQLQGQVALALHRLHLHHLRSRAPP